MRILLRAMSLATVTLVILKHELDPFYVLPTCYNILLKECAASALLGSRSAWPRRCA